MTNIENAFSSYDESIAKSKNQYSGLLGLAIGGHQEVNVPTRNGYVYVRLRDNLSEILQAYNDKVSPVYNFPVIIERKGNRWVVVGKDISRYENWGTDYPFLPAHGDTHSFNRDGGGGGDVVGVYPDQFMPLLVYPSGTYGAGNLLIAPYVLHRANDFIYVGNTGTCDLLPYKPINNQAVMGLVYLDTTSGVPGVLIGSGTPFAASITGTASVIQYLPNPSATQEPLYGFRLVSGTSAVTWDNLYNVRQFIGGGTSTGTGGTSDHESLTGLLGGSANNHYHLTPSQVSGLVSGTNTSLHSHSGTGLTNPVEYIQFIITGTYPTAEGLLTWDDTDGTLNLGMPGGNVTLQIGQETLLRVTNKTGAPLLNGNAVYVNGAQGSKPTVAKSKADAEATSYVAGVLTENIADNNNGYMTFRGMVRDVDTSAFLAGDILYLSPTVAGGLTKVKPIQPNHITTVGICLFSNASSGIILVDVHNGQELDELHDVLISSPANNDILTYVSASGTWMNKPSTGGGTPGGLDTYIQYNNTGTFGGDSAFTFKNTDKSINLGPTTAGIPSQPGSISQGATGTSVANFLETFGNTATLASYITMLRARGDNLNPTAVQKDDVLGRIRGRAADASGSYGNTSLELRMLADENHNTAGHATRMEVYTIPTGTITLVKMATFESSGNLALVSGTYNIGTNPHTHYDEMFMLMGG